MRSLTFDWAKKKEKEKEKLAEIEIFQAEPNFTAKKNCRGNRPELFFNTLHLKQIKSINSPANSRSKHSGK